MTWPFLPSSNHDLEFLSRTQKQGARLNKEQSDLVAQYEDHLDCIEEEAEAAWQKSID